MPKIRAHHAGAVGVPAQQVAHTHMFICNCPCRGLAGEDKFSGQFSLSVGRKGCQGIQPLGRAGPSKKDGLLRSSRTPLCGRLYPRSARPENGSVRVASGAGRISTTESYPVDFCASALGMGSRFALPIQLGGDDHCVTSLRRKLELV